VRCINERAAIQCAERLLTVFGNALGPLRSAGPAVLVKRWMCSGHLANCRALRKGRSGGSMGNHQTYRDAANRLRCA